MAFTSTLIENVAARGKRRLTFTHIDNGTTFGQFVEFRPDVVNATDYMAGHLAAFEASLIEGEHDRNLSAAGDTGNGTAFKYTTQAQFLVRLRILYGLSTGLRACFIGRWFHVANFADATLRTLFGITQGQVAGLRTKLSNQNTLLTNIAAENGVYP